MYNYVHILAVISPWSINFCWQSCKSTLAKALLSVSIVGALPPLVQYEYSSRRRAITVVKQCHFHQPKLGMAGDHNHTIYYHLLVVIRGWCTWHCFIQITGNPNTRTQPPPSPPIR